MHSYESPHENLCRRVKTLNFKRLKPKNNSIYLRQYIGTKVRLFKIPHEAYNLEKIQEGK